MKLILGSGSEGRQAVLKGAGYKFNVITADIDEAGIKIKDPKKLVLALARAKANAILPKIKSPAILITADQVVVCNKQILGKPKNQAEAENFIHGYEFHPMETVSSLLATNTQTGKCVEGIDIAKVYFKPIPSAIIKTGIRLGRVMRCSGAMRCEDEPFSDFVKKFVGTKDSTSGMPLKLLKKLLKEVKND